MIYPQTFFWISELKSITQGSRILLLSIKWWRCQPTWLSCYSPESRKKIIKCLNFFSFLTLLLNGLKKKKDPFRQIHSFVACVWIRTLWLVNSSLWSHVVSQISRFFVVTGEKHSVGNLLLVTGLYSFDSIDTLLFFK